MSKSISERRDGPLLECRGVTKRFGALVAVNRLSFELHRGEILGIGGPNGAGKTTLFDVISGFVPADEGTVSHEGHRIERMQTHAICHLGLARTFQLNAAFTTLTVFENVLAATCFGQSHTLLSSVRLNKTAVETTHELLDFAGLTERRGEPAGSLPVVDRKRLMVAAALATGPNCLLMDEPVGGLNPKEIGEMFELVGRIRERGISIILIEHVMRFLVSLSNRILIMHHGERLFLGPPAEMARDEQVVEVYLGKKASERIREYITSK